MQTSSVKNQRQDVRTLNAVLLKLRTIGWLWRAIVLVIVFLIWLWICQTILMLGSQITYEGLESLGPEVVKILTRINPYLWWGVVVIVSLIVFSIIRNWFILSSRRLRRKLVPVGEVQKLTATLSPESVQVLQWVWDATLEPVTIGDLLSTRNEIRSGRIRKLAMVQAQKKAIQDALSETPVRPADPKLETRVSAAPQAAPIVPEPEPVIIADKRPETTGKIEPVL